MLEAVGPGGASGKILPLSRTVPLAGGCFVLGLLSGVVMFSLEGLRPLSSSTFLHSHYNLYVSFNSPN